MNSGISVFELGLVPILLGLAFIVAACFLFNFIHMSSTPFKTMKAVYVYIAALIGLIVVATGLYEFIGYMFHVLFLTSKFEVFYIISPVAKIITGLFIMIPHWGIGHHFHLLERTDVKKTKKRK